MGISKVNSSLLASLEDYDSATVQNASILVRGYIDVNDDYSGPNLIEMIPTKKPLVGYAVTSTWKPINGNPGAEYNNDLLWNIIADVGAPVIAVLKDIDTPIRRGAIIGDGMAYSMKAMGAVGAVVDGNARDVPGIKGAGLGLWATGRVPGHGPFSMIEHQIPIEVSGLTINPGDILVCDGDGVTRVPIKIASDVVTACAEVRTKEKKMHTYFKSSDFSIEKWRSETKN